MKIISVLVLFSTLLFANKSLALNYDNMSVDNTVVCHGCSNQTLYQTAVNKALSIGFQDPVNNLETPITVHILDYESGNIIAYNVWDKVDLMTLRPYTLSDVSYKVHPDYRQDWARFSSSKSLFDDIFESDEDGFAFLSDPYVRSRTIQDISATFEGQVGAWRSTILQFINVLNILPSTRSIVKVRFAGSSVEVLIRVKSIGDRSADQIFKAGNWEYVPDSATIETDGIRVKLPDDIQELSLGFYIKVNESDKSEFEGYLTNFGFSLSGGSINPPSSLNISCTLTKQVIENENGSEKIINSYKCVKS